MAGAAGGTRETSALLAHWAAARPDAVAVATASSAAAAPEVITYEAADRRAHHAAAALALAAAPALAASATALCLVCCTPGAALVIALAAVARAGAAWVLLDAAHTPPQRLRALLGELAAGSGAVGAGPTSCALAAALAEAGPCAELLAAELPAAVPLLTLGHAAGSVSPAPARLLPGSPPAAVAYVCFTSGSTGRPKGVVVGRRGMENLLDCAQELLLGSGAPAAPRVAWATAPTFDIALLEVLLPLRAGGTLLPLAPAGRDPPELAAALARERADAFQGTPAAWAPLIAAAPAAGALPRWRLCGGEAMPPPLCPLLRQGAEGAWDAYGPTEATIWCCFHLLRPSDGDGGARPPLGPPVRYHRFHVVGCQCGAQGCASCPEGELVIEGPGVAFGYLRSPGAPFGRPAQLPPGADRTFQTGDLVRRGPGGELVFVGRRDAQVKVRGFRVELGDVEAALAAAPGVTQAAAVAVDLGGAGSSFAAAARAIVGFVVGADGAAAAARAAAAAALPGYMVPAAVVQLGALPLLPSGKVDRRALAEGFAAQRRSAAAEGGGLCEAVLAAARDVLGLPELGASDGLAQRGLDSVGAVLLAGQVGEMMRGMGAEKWHDVDDGVPLILGSRDAAQLAARLAAAAGLPAPQQQQPQPGPREGPGTAGDKALKRPRGDGGGGAAPGSLSSGEALLAACREGDAEAAAALVAQGAPLSAADRFGSSCLHYAAGAGTLGLCQMLLAAGADARHCDKKSGRSALHWAARKGQLPVVAWLVGEVGLPVESLTKDATTPLQLAAWGGHVPTADWLRQKGAAVGHINKWGCTAAHFAALAGELHVLQWLHAQGLDLGFTNHQGHSALHKAAYGGHGAACRWLAGPPASLPPTPDARGQDPAALARKAGHAELAARLAAEARP